MTYTVYIQSMNGFPVADWAVSAYMGFKEMQTNIVFFENIEDVPTSRWAIVVAEIGPTNEYLQRLGLGPKMALNIPEGLKKYCDRKVEYMTLKEFKEDSRYPIFVKPSGKAKEFVAGVLTRPDTKEWNFRNLPEDTGCLVSEVVDFVSEYRGYVIEGKLVGLKHYLGDFRIFPDVAVIDAAVADYQNAPAGYSIDFGVTSEGRTLLIECNDGWSLGNYGLDHSLYAKLLARRWRELLSTN